jgi:ketosteroid isomerase-like protein
MSNLETVQAIYEAFGRGDIPYILDQLAPDVAWEQWEDNRVQKAGVDYLQPRHGPGGVAEFFGIVGAMTFHEFHVLDLMAGERQVAAELLIDATRPNGDHIRDEEMHLWTFGPDGKVTRFRHYVDTAKHIEAAGL